jgi:hypothetical protein
VLYLIKNFKTELANQYVNKYMSTTVLYLARLALAAPEPE